MNETRKEKIDGRASQEVRKRVKEVLSLSLSDQQKEKWDEMSGLISDFEDVALSAENESQLESNLMFFQMLLNQMESAKFQIAQKLKKQKEKK